MKLSYFDLFLLILYALICLLIGYISSRRQRKGDYLIAGRKMTLAGFVSSVVASYIGGAAIVAYSAYVYEFGISAILVFVGTALGFLIFIPYALKLRKVSSDKEFLTLSDWIYYKYDQRTGVMSAAILFVVYFGMLLNQFIAGSTILANISGWSYELALIMSSLIITLYLFIGGFKSVVKTDIFQYIVLFILFVFLAMVMFKEDQSIGVELFDVSRMNPMMSIVFIAFGIFIIFQSAEYWQRVYAAKNNRVIKQGFRLSALLVIITGIAISIVGLAAYHHIPGLDGKDAFAEGLTLLLPDKLISVSLVILFAAIMSSADTIIFVLASSMAKDYEAVINENKGKSNDKVIRKENQVIYPAICDYWRCPGLFYARYRECCYLHYCFRIYNYSGHLCLFPF